MTADIPARTDADIEALIAATTPGPWTVSTHAMPGADIDDWFVREIAHDPDPRCHPTSVLKVRGARDAADECCWPPSVADADFIAAARELVPSLLARAQKAEANYADLYSRVGDLQASEAELVAAPLRAERDRLRAELAEAKAFFAGRLKEALARAQKAEANYAAVRAYIDSPGNWSAADARRSHILALLDGPAAANSNALSVENAALRARVRAVEAVCDDADRYDRWPGHWISTREVRAALASPATPEPSEGEKP